MKLTNLYLRIKSKLLRETAKQFNYRPNSYPFISGDGFREMADFIYDETQKFNPMNAKKGDIIFVASPFIKEYFTDIHPQIKYPYKLITHNGDNEIGEKESKYLDDKIIHWFAQNNTFEHFKITPIPIGIENKKWFMSGYTLVKNIKKLKKISPIKKNRILFGFNIENNPQERNLAKDELLKNTSADGIKNRLNNLEYFNLLNQYKYVASPPGNGIDCIRTWEAIYLNVVPIVKKSIMTEYFKDLGLPLYIINDWHELNKFKEKDLEKIYNDITLRKNDGPLFFNYWKDKINKTN